VTQYIPKRLSILVLSSCGDFGPAVHGTKAVHVKEKFFRTIFRRQVRFYGGSSEYASLPNTQDFPFMKQMTRARH